MRLVAASSFGPPTSFIGARFVGPLWTCFYAVGYNWHLALWIRDLATLVMRQHLDVCLFCNKPSTNRSKSVVRGTVSQLKIHLLRSGMSVRGQKVTCEWQLAVRCTSFVIHSELWPDLKSAKFYLRRA